MCNGNICYEVFINPALTSVGFGRALVRTWSWRRLNSDGQVEVRGLDHREMLTTFREVLAYRRRNGGSETIRVNLDNAVPQDAAKVRYLANADFQAILDRLSSVTMVAAYQH